jgi:Ras-related protein Rab-21
LLRHFQKKFDPGQISTVNPNYYEKKVEKNGVTYKFCFWDTAGQETYDALNSIYYNGAIAALIVYDSNEMETFTKVKKWVKELKNMLGPDVIFVVAGNKFDLIRSKSDLEKNEGMIQQYINEEKAKHFYTSAKSGENVNEAFEMVVELALEKVIKSGQKPKGKGKGLVIESGGNSKAKKGCCSN